MPSPVWLPALSNGTKIAGICADDSSVPCWRPEWSDTPDRLIDDYPEARSLTVIRDGSSYWVVVKNVYDKEPPRFSWELRPGIASMSGVIYWALAGVLVLIARGQARPRRRTAVREEGWSTS